MNDISKRYNITLNTKGTKTLASDQLIFNHGDDVTIEIAIVEDTKNKDITDAKVDLLLLNERDDTPVIHRFEDGGIVVSDNMVIIACKNSYIDRLGITVCQLIIRDDDQSITTQMFSYKTGSTLISEDMDDATDKINTLEELDKTIENCKSKIQEVSSLIINVDNKTSELITKVDNKTNELTTKVETEILSVDSVIKQVEHAEIERVKTFDQIKMDNESMRENIEDTIANVQDGITPNITIGNVVTLDPGVPATVVRRGSDENPIFDFGIPKGVDGFTPDMTDFEDRINKQYEDIVAENNDFRTQMNVDFADAKNDYFGKEHDNIVDRLNSDFDNVHQRINDSDYLAYSGTNTKADNSYYGLTKEMSVKGRTLQNCFPPMIVSSFERINGTIIDGYVLMEGDGVNWKNAWLDKEKCLIKPNAIYTLVCTVIENTLNNKLVLNSATDSVFNEYIYIEPKVIGTRVFKLTTKEDFTSITVSLRNYIFDTEIGKVKYKFMLLEGDHTNTPINELPFGEGIYSVGESEENLIKIKSCGKNICNSNNIKISDFNKQVDKHGLTWTFKDNKLYVNGTCTSMFDFRVFNDGYNINLYSYINSLKVGTSLCLSNNLGLECYFGVKIDGVNKYYANKLTITDNMKDITSFIRFNVDGVFNNAEFNIQVEENNEVTTYEPYQESTQELQLTEPLRSLPSGVCDEILEDGTEIRRVRKIVLDGSENWYLNNTSTTTTNRFMLKLKDGCKTPFHITKFICDKLQCYNWSDTVGKGITVNSTNMYIYNNEIEYTVEALKQWLQANPITVCYELAESAITKHSKNMNLKTFDGVTHITSDNYLQPIISCKIPTNVQTVIANLKRENEELNDAVSLMSLKNEEIILVNETQNELIDISLCATDEIFTMIEPLLPELINLSERGVTKMIDLYVAMVIRNLKTIDQVPERYREQVKKVLDDLEK